jgi:dihydropteroate synthase
MSSVKLQEFLLGVVNLTPDSFSDGNKLSTGESLLAHLKWLKQRGAQGFDIGAQSTAPGRAQVGSEEELRRFELLQRPPIQDWLADPQSPQTISIDTYWPEVMAKVVPTSFPQQKILWNDVSGVIDDAVMLFLSDMKKRSGHYVLCHNPVGDRNLSHQHTALEKNFRPKNVAEAVFQFFRQQLKLLPSSHRPQVILDPAFGFAKDASCNWALLMALPEIHQQLEREFSYSPEWMIGISKKRFLRQKVQELTGGATRDEFADSEILHLRTLDHLAQAFLEAGISTQLWWRVHDPLLLSSKKFAAF